MILRAILLAAMVTTAVLGDESAPSAAPAPTYVLVYDFTGPDGERMSDSIRLKLRRRDGLEVIDRISTQQMTRPTPVETPAAEVAAAMRRPLGVNLAIYGTVERLGDGGRVQVRCVDLRGGGDGWDGWERTFDDPTLRWRAVVSDGVTEAVTGQAQWVPPQYGDEPTPTAEALGRPLNVNGSFDDGRRGWDAPDNVSTMIVPGPGGGQMLRIRTDLQRDAWLAYRRDLLLGRADASNPPAIRRDTGYRSVGGMEGVHFASDWIAAEPGRRYWLLARSRNPGGAKIFLKGFADAPSQADGLPESSLAQLGLTPREFAALSPARRAELIAEDLQRHPERYRREVYRWYLNCGASRGQWMDFAAPVPPRGGLPENVRWLQIQVYAYWPAGEYLFDDVHLYHDPTQTDLLPEVMPRTPGYRPARTDVPPESP